MMLQLPDDVLDLIMDELQFDMVQDDHLDQATARAVCLTSRRLLHWGRKLLYRTVKVGSACQPQPRLAPAMAPRPLFRRFLQHSHLGALVEELEYAEIGFPGCEDEVLDINELDE